MELDALYWGIEHMTDEKIEDLFARIGQKQEPLAKIVDCNGDMIGSVMRLSWCDAIVKRHNHDIMMWFKGFLSHDDVVKEVGL